jgi:thiamine monophosphate kinase
MKAVLALTFALMSACAVPLLAHHSFVDGAVKDSKGEITRWAVEWGGGGQLSREGVTRETLKPGDHVIVSGNPGRNEADHRLRMQSIKRPKDGWGWKGVIQ